MTPAPTGRERRALRDLIGARVASARKQIGFSQRGLGSYHGMSGSWVREIERGGQFAPWWLVCWLSQASGLPVDWFCGAGLRCAAPAVEARPTSLPVINLDRERR